MKPIVRWISLPLGVALIIIGVPLFILPIPLGLPVIIAGLAIAATNPLFVRYLRKMRQRFPETSDKIRTVTPKMPGFIRHFLERTDAMRYRRGKSQKQDGSPLGQ